jgi:cbb3-type cytochrome oxidase maturation protein
MNSMWWLILIALGMGLAGLTAFLWSLRNGQYDDLDGAAERVLLEDDPDDRGKGPSGKLMFSDIQANVSANTMRQRVTRPGSVARFCL